MLTLAVLIASETGNQRLREDTSRQSVRSSFRTTWAT
jgi:hypothetical protein